jgi:hypothetical protein
MHYIYYIYIIIKNVKAEKNDLIQYKIINIIID